MKKSRLTKEEREIENTLNEYVSISREEFQQIADALQRRKKNAVLNIRINKYDLENIKKKAKKVGIKYQTFISEFLHRIAS